MLDIVDGRAPDVDLQHAGLRQGQQALEILDVDQFFAFLSLWRLMRSLISPAVACFWKKHCPSMPSGQRRSASGRLTRCGAI